MPGFCAVAALAACIFVQSAFPRWLDIAGTHPDLVLILMCYLAAADRRRSLTWAAFCAGLLQDVFSGYPLGINAFSKALVVLLIQSMHRPGARFYAKDWAKIIAFASLGDSVLTLLMIRALSTYQVFLSTTVATLAASVLYTTVAGIPALFVLSRLEWWADPAHRGSTVRR